MIPTAWKFWTFAGALAWLLAQLMGQGMACGEEGQSELSPPSVQTVRTATSLLPPPVSANVGPLPPASTTDQRTAAAPTSPPTSTGRDSERGSTLDKLLDVPPPFAPTPQVPPAFAPGPPGDNQLPMQLTIGQPPESNTFEPLTPEHADPVGELPPMGDDSERAPWEPSGLLPIEPSAPAMELTPAEEAPMEMDFFPEHNPPPGPATADPSTAIPGTMLPASNPLLWWNPQVTQPLRDTSEPHAVTIQSLISATLQYSSRVHVISDTPLIREAAIYEADAEFNWAAFLESNWNDIDEPVGSTLTTGGPSRFSNEIFDYETGLRKRNRAGGQFQIDQSYGTEKSNSVFFVPNPQGTSRLTLSYSHPLLRGGGPIYNTSLVVLAEIESGIAKDDFASELQNHLTEVVRGYWALYLERGALLQRQRLYDRGGDVLSELEHRRGIDVVENQLVRARAAVAARKSELYRAAAAVKNAEARIRALVNAPQLGHLEEIELTPADVPQLAPLPLELQQAIEVAIRNRPEVLLAMKQIKAAGVRVDVAKNEILPLLDVVMETYVAGLRGDRNVGGAFVDQFSVGAPSYTAGLRMEVPIGNRAAQARFQRCALEMRQFQSQLKATLAALQLEVEIAVREVQTANREVEAKYQALDAAATEVDFIARRWKHLAGDDRTASLFLEDLFSAQERLTAQEFEYLSAEVDYNLAMIELQRVMGTLLHVEGVLRQSFLGRRHTGPGIESATRRIMRHKLVASIPSFRRHGWSLRASSHRPRSVDTNVVDQIQTLVVGFASRRDQELATALQFLRQEVVEGRDLLDQTAVATSFALTYEAIRRTTGLVYYDVQLLAGIALCTCAVAEMSTGEGKTLVAALPSVLYALRGRGVHVATVNTYLAQRDFELLQPAYQLLGLSAALLPEGGHTTQKRPAYEADITYGTGYEFGFDYLRDQAQLRAQPTPRLGEQFRRRLRGQAPSASRGMQRELAFAIIDEIDSVLLDEANTPLIISADENVNPITREIQGRAAEVAASLQANRHYLVKPRERTIVITDAGHAAIFEDHSLVPMAGLVRPWQSYVEQALRAQLLMRGRRLHRAKRENSVGRPVHRAHLYRPHLAGRFAPGRGVEGTSSRDARETRHGADLTTTFLRFVRPDLRHDRDGDRSRERVPGVLRITDRRHSGTDRMPPRVLALPLLCCSHRQIFRDRRVRSGARGGRPGRTHRKPHDSRERVDR